MFQINCPHGARGTSEDWTQISDIQVFCLCHLSDMFLLSVCISLAWKISSCSSKLETKNKAMECFLWFYSCMGLPWWLSGKESATIQEPQEMQVWSLGQEDPMEKETATPSSILSWRAPWIEEPGELQSMGSQRVGHNWSDLACTQ